MIRVVWMLKLMVVVHKNSSVPGRVIQYITCVIRASGISAIDKNDKEILT